MRHFILFIFTFSFAINLVTAQECPCNKALETATQNEFLKQTSKDFKQSLSVLFTYDYEFWESYSSYQNKTADLDAGFAIFSSSFSESTTREEKKAKYQNMKQSYKSTNNIEQKDYEFIAQKSAADIVYNAWIKCLEISCSTNQDRMVLSYVVTGNDVTVTLHWYKKSNDSYTWVNNVLPGSNAEYVAGNLYAGQRIQSQNVLTSTFRRINPHQEVSINVGVKNYDVQPIVIPGLPIETPGSSFPVGTIVTSVLDYATFCKLNNEPEVLNLKKSKWVPCDGRGVGGSDYGAYQANVPDLRGVFLRALNDFGVKGVDKVSDAQKDIEGDGRPANNLQQQAFLQHQHSLAPFYTTNDFDAQGGGGGGKRMVYKNDKPTGDSPTGGKETRPTNKTVYYYIRINR